MELEDIFRESKPFRRAQQQSPIYLQWSKGVEMQLEKNPPGFQVHSFATKAKIGFISTQLNKTRKSVDLTSVRIDDSTVGAEVFRTLLGIFKASKSKLPPEITYLCHTCSFDNKETIDSAKEAGFVESQRYSSSSQIHLEKEIPVQEPALSQESKGKQETSLKTTKPIAPSPIPDQSALPSSPFIDSTASTVGQKHPSKEYSDIYFQYAPDIDVENVMEVPMKGSGFKIFRKQEKDEIGYIVSRYLPKPGEIRICAIWINKNMRSKGYGSQAMRRLLALWTSKKSDYPAAKTFSVCTKKDNKAMIKIAKNIGFVETLQSGLEGDLDKVFGGILFTKPFE